MRNLIVYYSLEGNTKFVAKKIALHSDSKLLEVKPSKKFKYRSFIKYIIGGLQAVIRYKPELKRYEIQNNKYNTLFIGTPVWANSMTPVIRSFLNSLNIEVDHFALFSTSMQNSGRVFKHMKNYLQKSEVIGEKNFIDVLNNKQKTEQEVKKWLQDLKIEIK